MNIWLYLIGFIAFFINACSSHMETNRTFNPESYIPIEGKNCKMYFDGTPPSDPSYKVYWDGECKDGYSDGIGRELSSDGIEFIALYNDKLPYYVYSKHDTDEFKIGNYFDNGEFVGIKFYSWLSYYEITYIKDGKYSVLETHDDGEFCGALLTNGSVGQCVTKMNIKNTIVGIDKDNLKAAIAEYKNAINIINKYKDRICSMKSIDKNGAYLDMIKIYKNSDLNESSYFSICSQNMDYHLGMPKYIADFLDSL